MTITNLPDSRSTAVRTGPSRASEKLRATAYRSTESTIDESWRIATGDQTGYLAEVGSRAETAASGLIGVLQILQMDRVDNLRRQHGDAETANPLPPLLIDQLEHAAMALALAVSFGVNQVGEELCSYNLTRKEPAR